MREVYKALAFALILVLAVIQLFLGSFRATLVPAAVVLSSWVSSVTRGYSLSVC